jgi:pimeloyl-ACP methyl ester carboxylesterase
LKIRELELNVQTKGEGPTFIWGHGLSASIEAEDILDRFEWGKIPENIKLVRYDARGHGKSQLSKNPEDYHWRNLGKDMLAIADELGVERFIAGGVSMGTATSIYAAIQAPERIQALLLVAPPTIWETRADQGKLWNRFALVGGILGGRLLAKMISKNLDRVLPKWLVENEPENIQGVIAGIAAQKRRALWNIFRGAGKTDLPPREEFKSIEDIPCLILGWHDDKTHPVSSSEQLHQVLPKSKLFLAQGYDDFKTIPQRIRGFVTNFVS